MDLTNKTQNNENAKRGTRNDAMLEKKRGRKRIDESLKKKYNVTFYVNEGEYELLKKYAELQIDSVSGVSKRIVMQRVRSELCQKDDLME